VCDRLLYLRVALLSSFGLTHCAYTSNPSSPRNTALEAALAACHGLRSVRLADADELAAGGDATRRIVDAEFLRRMKKHAVLVNTSRGTLVGSDALALALRKEWIWGAGLDGVEGEPHIDADRPLVKEPRSVCTFLRAGSVFFGCWEACH
jgi:glyoxylate/hydroxypyruvate reductase